MNTSLTEISSKLCIADLSDIHIHRQHRYERREMELSISAIHNGKEYGVCIPIKIKSIKELEPELLGHLMDKKIHDGLNQILRFIEKDLGPLRVLITNGLKQYEA